MILSDTYKPHTYQETLALVGGGTARTRDLDPNGEYAIRWWNRSSQKTRQISEAAANGERHYRRKVTFAPRDEGEWIAVPIPAFLLRDLVEMARAMIAAPRSQERKNLARGWELRGVIRCPSCGAAMSSHTATRGEKLYHYYRCHRSVDYRRNSCKQRMERAQKAEEAMWEFVSGVLKDPERISVGMDALIEQKRAAMHSDPKREERAWLEQLSEVNQERRNYQRLAVKGHMTDEELDDALSELQEIRKTAERELDALRHRQEEMEALERDREALMVSWATAVPDGLDHLTPEERNEIYHRLRLEIRPQEGGGYEITGPFCTSEPLPSSGDRYKDRSPCTPPRSPRRRQRAGCGLCHRSARWPRSCR
jgi:hypothetical protein